LLNKQITVEFEANSLSETISKTITFKFVMKAKNAVEEEKSEPEEEVILYCSGNYNATATF
jgi:hypothetical protein